MRWLVAATLLLAFLVLAVACETDTPQNTFATEGEVADRQRDLLNLVLWPAGVIFVLVQGIIIYALVRFRRRRADEVPVQVHGNTRLEFAWTLAPAALLIGLAVPIILGVIELGRAPAADALNVRVTGLQWRWQFEYLDEEYQTADGEPLRVFDELHIPVGREIGVELESMDVLHSFWVPRLAGKLDAVPGRTNRMWFNALSAGSFAGQCAEFCGLGHADMRLTVVAESEEDFEAWIGDQLAQASAETGEPEPAVSQGD